MGFIDKLLGRSKKTEDDMMGDSSMQSEGMHEEKQGMADDRAEGAEGMTPAEGEKPPEHDNT